MASSPQFAREPNAPIGSKQEYVRKATMRFATGIVVAVLFLGLAYVGLILARRPALTKNDSVPRAVYPDPSTLGLTGSRVGQDIQITWNPQSPAFADVKIGILTIKDGESQQEIALTAAELQARTLVYTPATNRVQASLEAFSRDRKSSRESVLFVLEPRDESTPPLVEAAGGAGETSARQVAVIARESQQRSRAEQPAVPPLRDFTPPPAPVRTTPERVVVLDPPPSLDMGHAAIASAPAVQLLQTPFPRPPEAQQPPPTSQAQAQQPPRLPPAARAKPRTPVRQVRAQLPPNVISMLSDRVQIDVRARVDATGKVVHAESLASKSVLNQYLATAALSAARLWRFEPGGNGTDTIILKFVFEPR
jgi:hypothetical protein